MHFLEVVEGGKNRRGVSGTAKSQALWDRAKQGRTMNNPVIKHAIKVSLEEAS